MVLCDPNNHKREDYIIGFIDSNFQNNFYTTIAHSEVENNQIHSKCVYIDIENAKQNLLLKQLFAIDITKANTEIILITPIAMILY